MQRSVLEHRTEQKYNKTIHGNQVTIRFNQIKLFQPLLRWISSEEPQSQILEFLLMIRA